MRDIGRRIRIGAEKQFVLDISGETTMLLKGPVARTVGVPHGDPAYRRMGILRQTVSFCTMAAMAEFVGTQGHQRM